MKPMGKKSRGALLMAGVMALLVAALALTLYQEAALPAGEEPAALAAEVQSGLLKQHHSLAAEPLDIIKRVRTTLQQDSLACQELN